jgi:hypothetical protein
VVHGWLLAAAAGVPLTIGLVGLYVLWLRVSERPLYDPDLDKEKLSRPAAHVELRLSMFAPADVGPETVRGALDQLVAAYRAYDLERGNRLVARPLRLGDAPDCLCVPAPVGTPRRRLATLGTRELAALWHQVKAGDDVALVERTTAFCRCRRLWPMASGLE